MLRVLIGIICLWIAEGFLLKSPRMVKRYRRYLGFRFLVLYLLCLILEGLFEFVTRLFQLAGFLSWGINPTVALLKPLFALLLWCGSAKSDTILQESAAYTYAKVLLVSLLLAYCICHALFITVILSSNQLDTIINIMLSAKSDTIFWMYAVSAYSVVAYCCVRMMASGGRHSCRWVGCLDGPYEYGTYFRPSYNGPKNVI
jgi:hypothetical protein